MTCREHASIRAADGIAAGRPVHPWMDPERVRELRREFLEEMADGHNYALWEAVRRRCEGLSYWREELAMLLVRWAYKLVENGD